MPGRINSELQVPFCAGVVATPDPALCAGPLPSRGQLSPTGGKLGEGRWPLGRRAVQWFYLLCSP